MYLAIFGLIAVLLLVFLVLSAKTWSWVHIIALLLVFGAATAWGVFASQLFAYRHAWMKQLDINEKAYADAKEAHRQALYGDVSTGGYGSDSLFGTQQVLLKHTSERGRVWSNGNVAETGNGYELTFTSTPDPNDPSASEATTANLAQDMVVYAFKNQDINGVQLPIEFQGVFNVIEVNGNVVRLELVQDLSNIDIDASGQWGLYENMPMDRHEVFQDRIGMSDEDFDADTFRQDLQQYFSIDNMYSRTFKQRFANRYIRLFVPEGTDPPSEEEFNKMLQEKFGFPGPNAGAGGDQSVRDLTYAKMLDQYIYDGLEINRIETIDPGFEVTEENMDVVLRFTENSQSFRVDGTSDMKVLGRIGPDGLTNDPRLKHGGEIVLPKDRRIKVAKTTQDRYSENSSVEEEQSFYRRPLHDYSIAFSMNSDIAERLDKSIARIVKQNREFQLTLDDAQKQLDHRNDVIMALDADSNQFDEQLTKATEMVQSRHETLSQRYDEFQKLYKLIGVMSEQLKETATSLRDEIDRRTDELTKNN